MKIAVVSDDGQTISQHFGRAQHYVVLTIENGQITGRELREKFGHKHGSGDHPGTGEGHIGAAQAECDPSSSQRFSPLAEDSHSRMAASISDCTVVVARGMGAPAYYSMQRAGIQPMVVNETSVDEAAQALITGSLVDHRERLH
jgi:predicted Fe-Mo cluster-binding NifX family protein